MPESSPVEIPELPPSDHRLSRREFARRAALTATTAVVAPATLLSQQTAPSQLFLRTSRRKRPLSFRLS